MSRPPALGPIRSDKVAYGGLALLSFLALVASCSAWPK